MLQNVLLITALLSIPALVISVRRTITRPSLPTAIVMLLAMGLTATYVSALFHVDDFMAVIDMANGLIKDKLEASHFAHTLLYFSILVNILLFVSALTITKRNIWLWGIVWFTVLLLSLIVVGVVASHTLGVSFDKCFFMSCCALMGVVGTAWGLTYEEICVIGNIYIQGALVCLSGLWVLWASLKPFRSKKTFLTCILLIFGLAIGLACTGLFVWLCYHYNMSLLSAYHLCIDELIWLARHYHTTYNIVNYIIFIVLFLLVVVGNMMLAVLINRIGKRGYCKKK